MSAAGSTSSSAALAPTAWWVNLIEALRRSRQSLLAGALSHACPLDMRPGLVRIGFGPDARMAREQVLRSQREIEVLLTRQLGVASVLEVESISAEQARGCLAVQERTQREAREERQLRACQDCGAVRLAQKILLAKIDRIDLFEAAESDFANAEFPADESQDL